MSRKCGKESPRKRACTKSAGHEGDHEARTAGGIGTLIERWPRSPEGKPPKPAKQLRVAADGTPEIKVSGIPVDTLEAMEAYVKRHRLRGRNALVAMCAAEGFAARLREEEERKAALAPRRGRSA